VRGVSNLVAGLLLAIITASIAAVVLWRLRESGALGEEPKVVATVTAFAVRYNATHYMLVVYNYGYAAREGAKIVRSDGYVYSIDTIPPRSSPIILYVPVYCGGSECTYMYVDSSERGIAVGVIKR
jgi:hypothetical protein